MSLKTSWLVVVLAIPLQLFSVAVFAARSKSEKAARSITIFRDQYGVPHIYAPTDGGCVFGSAYAQAEDHFERLEDAYLRAIGRAAEAYGEQALADDLHARQLEVERWSKEEYQRSDLKFRQLCDAFADGLNYFLARHPQVKPKVITHFEPWQVLAYYRYCWFHADLPFFTGLREELQTVALAPEREPFRGSNAWAVGVTKSATGHAMLFINPHDPFFEPGDNYEIHRNYSRVLRHEEVDEWHTTQLDQFVEDTFALLVCRAANDHGHGIRCCSLF